MIDINQMITIPFKKYKKESLAIQNATPRKMCKKEANDIVPQFSSMVEIANLMEDDPAKQEPEIKISSVVNSCAGRISKFDEKMRGMKITCGEKGLVAPKKEMINALDVCMVDASKGTLKGESEITPVLSLITCTNAAVKRITGDKRVSDCVTNNKTLVKMITDLMPVLVIGSAKMSEAMDKL